MQFPQLHGRLSIFESPLMMMRVIEISKGKKVFIVLE